MYTIKSKDLVIIPFNPSPHNNVFKKNSIHTYQTTAAQVGKVLASLFFLMIIIFHCYFWTLRWMMDQHTLALCHETPQKMQDVRHYLWSAFCYRPIGLQLSEKWNLLKIYNRRYFPILNLNRDFHIFQGDWRLNLNNPCLPVYHTTLIVHTTTWLMFLKIPK